MFCSGKCKFTGECIYKVTCFVGEITGIIYLLECIRYLIPIAYSVVGKSVGICRTVNIVHMECMKPVVTELSNEFGNILAYKCRMTYIKAGKNSGTCKSVYVFYEFLRLGAGGAIYFSH